MGGGGEGKGANYLHNLEPKGTFLKDGLCSYRTLTNPKLKGKFLGPPNGSLLLVSETNKPNVRRHQYLYDEDCISIDVLEPPFLWTFPALIFLEMDTFFQYLIPQVFFTLHFSIDASRLELRPINWGDHVTV